MTAEGKDVSKACGESRVRGSAVVHSRIKPATQKKEDSSQCKVDLNYKSRFDHHVKTARHLALARVLFGGTLGDNVGFELPTHLTTNRTIWLASACSTVFLSSVELECCSADVTFFPS